MMTQWKRVQISSGHTPCDLPRGNEARAKVRRTVGQNPARNSQIRAPGRLGSWLRESRASLRRSGQVTMALLGDSRDCRDCPDCPGLSRLFTLSRGADCPDLSTLSRLS